MPRNEIYKSKDAERRYDRFGQFRILARVEGAVICRRKGCSVVVMSEREWQELVDYPVSSQGERDANCVICAVRVPLHEDALGFHHVVDGRRVPCRHARC